jgi:hypothetical protein
VDRSRELRHLEHGNNSGAAPILDGFSHHTREGETDDDEKARLAGAQVFAYSVQVKVKIDAGQANRRSARVRAGLDRTAAALLIAGGHHCPVWRRSIGSVASR